MHLALRLLALVVVAVVAFVANAYAQQYWAGLLFPRVVPRPYSEMVSAAVVGAVAAAAVAALPLAKLFESKAWVAGLFVALPVIALRAPEVGTSGTQAQEATAVMAWVEMFSYTLAVVCAAWLLSRRTRRAKSAL
jgi:small basic protein